MRDFGQVLAQAMSRNLVDERKAAVFANARKLPNGFFGLCFLSLRGNTLLVSDAGPGQTIGEILYQIPLNQVSALRCSPFVFNRYLKFSYQDSLYHFADFGDAKRFIGLVMESV